MENCKLCEKILHIMKQNLTCSHSSFQNIVEEITVYFRLHIFFCGTFMQLHIKGLGDSLSYGQDNLFYSSKPVAWFPLYEIIQLLSLLINLKVTQGFCGPDVQGQGKSITLKNVVL